MNNLYANLAKVQVALNAPKNQWNNFGNYNYRSCEDILSAAKPLCVENGLMLSITDEIIFVEGRHYVQATAMVINIEDGSDHSVRAQARETENKKGMDSAQVTGSTSSYARKYALNGLFCIDDTKDPDTQKPPENKPQETKKLPTAPLVKEETPDPESKPEPEPQKVNTAQLIDMAKKKGFTEEYLIKKFNSEQDQSIEEVKRIWQECKVSYYNKLSGLPDEMNEKLGD